jgi:predicted membrane protein
LGWGVCRRLSDISTDYFKVVYSLFLYFKNILKKIESFLYFYFKIIFYYFDVLMLKIKFKNKIKLF